MCNCSSPFSHSLSCHSKLGLTYYKQTEVSRVFVCVGVYFTHVLLSTGQSQTVMPFSQSVQLLNTIEQQQQRVGNASPPQRIQKVSTTTQTHISQY